MSTYQALIIQCCKLWLFHEILSLVCCDDDLLFYFWCLHSTWFIVGAQEIHVARMNVLIAYGMSSSVSWVLVLFYGQAFWLCASQNSFLGYEPMIRLTWCCFVYWYLQLLFAVTVWEWNGHKNDFWCLIPNQWNKAFTQELTSRSFSGGKISIVVALLMSCLATCHSEAIDKKMRNQFKLSLVNQIWNPLLKGCF